MKPRITVITIGVDDLERSLRFYRDGLGLKTEGIVGQEFEYGRSAKGSGRKTPGRQSQLASFQRRFANVAYFR